jgi:hypothetical protein
MMYDTVNATNDCMIAASHPLGVQLIVSKVSLCSVVNIDALQNDQSNAYAPYLRLRFATTSHIAHHADPRHPNPSPCLLPATVGPY